MKIPAIFTGKRKRLFGRLLINAGLQAGSLLVTATLVRHVFDHFLTRDALPWDQITLVGAAMAATALVVGWLQRRERILAEDLGQSYVHQLRRQLFTKVTRMAPRQLQRRRRGAIMLKFIGDLNAVRRWVSLGIVRIIVSGAIVLSTLVALAQIDPLLSLVAAIIIACGTIANARIGRSLRQAAREVRKRRARLSANINEKISQMAVVQLFGRSEDETHRVRRHSQLLRRASVRRAGKIGFIRGVNQAVTAAMTTAVLITGVIRVHNGQTTPGAIAAAIAILGFLVPALRNLGRIYEYYQEAAVSRQKLTEFLTIPTPIKSRRRRPPLVVDSGRLTFADVTVNGVLDGVSAKVRGGEKIALAGPNGAGKSMLLNLVGRMVAPDRGRIYIDGQNIARVQLDSVRQAIGFVGPDLPLLSGSLDRNISYRNPDCDPAEINRVKALCGIHRMEDRLIAGDRTRIHERGRNLSAGQRQRIALARALVGTPPILLLDEVDSHLDANARRLLINVVQSYPGTVLWATHISDPIPGIDAIWQVDNGQVVRRTNEKRPFRAIG